MMGQTVPTLQDQFGQIDIYLFDQLLRGRIPSGSRILDAGCGSGRNLVYFLQNGYEVFAADRDVFAIEETRRLAAAFAPTVPAANFRVEAVEKMSFPKNFATMVILNSVLHFARDEEHFRAMLGGAWDALKRGGILFCRLASTIGIEHDIQLVSGRIYFLPDGSERFLVDEMLLMKLTAELGGELLDPLKTTVVQNQRSMTTWVVGKQPRR
jgi:tellurite methyltransferase